MAKIFFSYECLVNMTKTSLELKTNNTLQTSECGSSKNWNFIFQSTFQGLDPRHMFEVGFLGRLGYDDFISNLRVKTLSTRLLGGASDWMNKLLALLDLLRVNAVFHHNPPT